MGWSLSIHLNTEYEYIEAPLPFDIWKETTSKVTSEAELPPNSAPSANLTVGVQYWLDPGCSYAVQLLLSQTPKTTDGQSRQILHAIPFPQKSEKIWIWSRNSMGLYTALALPSVISLITQLPQGKSLQHTKKKVHWKRNIQ